MILFGRNKQHTRWQKIQQNITQYLFIWLLLDKTVTKGSKFYNICDVHHLINVLGSNSNVCPLGLQSVIQEVMKAQKRNSAGPTVAEYRDQIKGNLMTARKSYVPQAHMFNTGFYSIHQFYIVLLFWCQLWELDS